MSPSSPRSRRSAATLVHRRSAATLVHRRSAATLASVAAVGLGLTALVGPAMIASAGPAPEPFTTPADSAFSPAPVALGPAQQAAVAKAKAVSSKNPSGAYIVQLAGDPIATYTGGIPGLARTAPTGSASVDTRSPAAARYRTFLAGKRASALASVGGGTKLYDYTVAFNGFAAKLTAAQAALLRHTPGVVAVARDENRKLDTTSTPDQLGLTGPTGVWQKQFGGAARAGDGVIVGMVDSGLWSENPSFAALPPQASDAAVKARFKGVCDAGTEAPAFTCNSKVIGGRYFVKGFQFKNLIPEEYVSPRDFGGHGSHTSGTAAGDNNVPVVINNTDFGRASGMAPDARIAVYKVCWNGGSGSCANTDIVAAIDAAVSDGVDVINFSISGSLTTVYDATEIAFYNAAKAGVFVAASAGNSGPDPSTVAHNSPWLTTVAAGTKDVAPMKSTTLGNGATYTGVGQGGAVASSPLVASTAVGVAGKPADEVRLCFADALDPAKVSGKIVQCDRGVNPRTDKSAEVKRAGGVGMLLTNVGPNSLDADLHAVPTVHLDEVAGAAVKAYIASTPAPTASIAATVNSKVEAPQVAGFSSRGPALAGDGNLLKPDIMAPGVSVLAAVAPPDNSGRNFDFYSGTSMASPHIAGIAALIIGKHPTWSPAEVKSALMTTATTTDNRGKPITDDNGGPAGAFAYGSGFVVPARAFDPGLVYRAGAADWDRFGCNYAPVTPALTSCAGVKALDPSGLNYPSIAIGALAGSKTVTRTVTNVSSTTSTYRASGKVAAGFTATVRPTTLRLAPGSSATYTLTVTRTSAPFDAYAEGSVSWSDGSHVVRTPVVVRPVLASSPEELTFTGGNGSQTGTITAGFTGTATTSVRGLVPSTVSPLALAPSGPQFDPAAPQVESPRTKKVTVTVPAGTTLLRYATYDADVAPNTDVDIYVYQAGTAKEVAASAAGGSNESVTVPAPTPGAYDVYVSLYDGPAQTVPLHSYLVGATAAGNLRVTPQSQRVTVGQPFRLTVTRSGLAPGKRWLGWGAISDGKQQRTTIVSGTS